MESEDGLPFFSRRLGLDARGRAVRLDGGVKMTGRVGAFNIGVLGIRQDLASGPGTTDLFVGRLVTNVLAESSVGVIATSGNPAGGRDNALAGFDFRYLNTRLGEDRALEAAAWFQQSSTEGLHDDEAAYGASLMMPNNHGWRGGAGIKTLQKNYFPALGFANRTNIVDYDFEVGHTWRPENSWLRAIYSGVEAERIDALDGDEQTQEIELKAFEAENQTADSLTLAQIFIRERAGRTVRNFRGCGHSDGPLFLRSCLRGSSSPASIGIWRASRPSARATSSTAASSRCRPS